MTEAVDRLLPCENSGNCVCTEDGDAAPLPYDGLSPEEARRELRAILHGLGGTKIVQETQTRVHATCRVFVFTDDLHARFDDAAGLVHLRSASRVGRHDLGVNRRRIERIRKQWDARQE